MVAGVVALAVLLRRGRREDAAHGTLHIGACVVGVVAYFGISEHRTAVEVLGGGSVMIGHYVFWAVSESLTVLAVAIVALPPLKNLAGAMTMLWPLYIVTWFLGVPGLHVWAENGDHISFAVLDIVTNVGIAVVNVVSINRLAAESDADEGETSIAWSARQAS